jgi:hypothetical protein
VGAAIAASWILAMHLQALVLAVGTLRQGGCRGRTRLGVEQRTQQHETS